MFDEEPFPLKVPMSAGSLHVDMRVLSHVLSCMHVSAGSLRVDMRVSAGSLHPMAARAVLSHVLSCMHVSVSIFCVLWEIVPMSVFF